VFGTSLTCSLFLLIGYREWKISQRLKDDRARVRQEWDIHIQNVRSLDLAHYLQDDSQRLVGIVRDRFGRPIKNARISLYRHDLSADDVEHITRNGLRAFHESRLIGSCLASSEGRFEHPTKKLGRYLVTIESDDHSATSRFIHVEDGRQSYVDVVLDLENNRRFPIPDESLASSDWKLQLIPSVWFSHEIDSFIEESTVEIPSRGIFASGVLLARKGNLFRAWPYSITDTEEAIGTEVAPPSISVGKDVFASFCSPVAMFYPIAITPRIQFMEATSKPVRGTHIRSIEGKSVFPFSPVCIQATDFSQVTWSDASREFRFNDIPIEEFAQITCVGANRGQLSRSKVVSALANTPVYFSNEDQTHGDLSQSSDLHVLVQDPQGVPIDEASIVIQDASNFRNYLRSKKTDPNGAVRFSAVPRNRTYLLFATHKVQVSPLKNFEYVVVDSAPSTTPSFGLLNQQIKILTVYRGIIHCKNLPTSFVECRLKTEGETSETKSTHVIGVKRTAIFENVPPGEYKLVFTTDSGSFVTRALVINEETIVLDGAKESFEFR